jgi:uncharacterized protein (TIGR00730 family)
MTEAQRRIQSICLYCGSSDDADPLYLEAAGEFGRALAQAGVRLVYGGGGVGLMGAAARAAHAAGGRVLGVMPEFLRRREILYDEVETVVVRSMHERKLMMFEESDAFAVFPGGIGTLEEVVELLSWRRLELHSKPIVFVDLKGYWKPFYALIEHTIREKLTPASFSQAFISVERADQVLPALIGRAAA